MTNRSLALRIRTSPDHVTSRQLDVAGTGVYEQFLQFAIPEYAGSDRIIM
jgi:hypothetical protein